MLCLYILLVWQLCTVILPYIKYFSHTVSVLYSSQSSNALRLWAGIMWSAHFRYTVKKRLATFPARESFVSDIPAGDGNVANLFLRFIIMNNIEQRLTVYRNLPLNRVWRFLAKAVAQLSCQTPAYYKVGVGFDSRPIVDISHVMVTAFEGGFQMSNS